PAPSSPIIENYVKCFPFVWAKPAQATAAQPPAQLSFRRFVPQSNALPDRFVSNIPCACSPYPAFFQRKVQWQAMHFGTAHSSIPVR
ncbi:hypothetical protein, partial [Kaistella sp.]|uniref:hypothetical protein n=1 Tax=Kaistella sp. TaxID=2782235 RepID=UPI002F95FD03